jgi:hypothetical protein
MGMGDSKRKYPLYAYKCTPALVQSLLKFDIMVINKETSFHPPK